MNFATLIVVGLIALCLGASTGLVIARRRLGMKLDRLITDHDMKLREIRVERDVAATANYEKSAFLANLSHEIRTPLNGILGLTDILAVDNLTDGQMRKVNLINDSSETLMRLLNDILDISKIEAGGMEIEHRNIDLGNLLHNVYSFWNPAAKEKNIDLVFQKQRNLPTRIMADSTRVRQCMDNLINNALKFTPENGRIVIKTTSPAAGDQRTIFISVEDSGVGIQRDVLDKIFRPFKQANVKTARKFGGTGLGLAITRKLCRLMGGNVIVHSVPGQGTTFLMSFSANLAEDLKPNGIAAEATVLAPEIVSNLSGLRCLVVEDNGVNLEVLRLLLEPFELDIVETSNGHEALNALERQRFDLVLMDLQMPVLGGVAAIDIIRKSGKAYANIPIVVMTANAMSEDRVRSFEVGADEFLTKPLRRSSLAAAINSAVYPTPHAQESVA
jgi:signal transduction histidine kinase/CheY-like chemotaxis protein